jgi:ATP-binding cassette subfamily B protein
VIAALAALAPAFLAGRATLAQQAITFGAVLFASASLEKLTFGLTRVAAAWIAWGSAKPMFDAGSQPARQAMPGSFSAPAGKALQARNVGYTHPGRLEPVLKGCTLEVERGDRVLLEGGSGSGKSTFASLLAGFRRPSSGLILAGGLDLRTVGDANWRRRIATAPQYHENHILSAPLGFNLLMARPYPHSARDLHEASDLCHELGLGPLIERMPGGLDQMVGETGWQLSQGERSRVFLARALLQNADLVLLDESLAALDPENLRQCLKCVVRRAKTLMVIAHP